MINLLSTVRKLILITLILTILLIPLPIIITSNNKTPILPKTSNYALISEGSYRSYLFTYQKGEERLIEEFFMDSFHRAPSFFQNLNIGMISLTLEEQSLVQHQDSRLISQMQVSTQVQMLPSVEELLDKEILNIKQSTFDNPSTVVNATVMYENGFDGEGVKIAILDSGIDSYHQDISSVIYEESFVTKEYGYSSNESVQDLHGHGTHVAGIAAGSGDRFPGVAYNALLLNLKVADMFGGATIAGLIAAINRSIAEDVDVISISLGFDLSTPFDTEDILIQAVNSAVDQGISVVVSAGNEASEPVPYTTIGSPGSASKVITVGASNGSKNVVSFSSQGPTLDFRVDPDIVAPGYQIVGPLAFGGVLDRAYNALVGVSISDYIVLSGTSMSAPVVSGAVALLKQQFPDASPHALRAALLESADDLGGKETIYTQGNGLINVGKAADLLSRSKTSFGYELVSSLPRASDKPIEFFYPLAFPGDSSKMTVSFMTGSGGTITWGISESLTPFIEFDLIPTTLSSAGYFEKEIKLEIPLNVPIGNYSGYIRYTAYGKNYDLLITFTVQKPQTAIYWDSYHTGRDDSFLYNYRQLNEILQDSSYKYDVNDHFTTISGEALAQSDILVLTDLEYSMSEEELNMIKDFHDNNGSIILLTSFFPYYNLDPYVKLSSLLNLPINLTDQTTLIDYVDNGRDREPIETIFDIESLSWDDNSPFFNGVNIFPSMDGTAFVGNTSDPTLTHYLKYVSEFLLAGIEPVNKGKILVIGSENWLLPSYLSTGSGLTFLSNILTWLTPERPTVNLEVSVNTSSVEIALYSSQMKDYHFSLTFENGSTVGGYKISYNSTLGFNYHNLTINGSYLGNIRIDFQTNESLAPLYFDFTNRSTSSYVQNIEVIKHSNQELIVPSWASSDLELVNEALTVNVNHTESPFIFGELIISSQAEKTLSVLVPPRYSITSYTNESILLNISNTQKSVNWDLQNDYPIGYYSYEVQIWWNNSFGFSSILHSERGNFYVPDEEPILLTSQSSVGGISFDDHEEMTGIPAWDPNQDIEMFLFVSDNNGMQNVEIHIQFLHYYLYAADRTVLDHLQMNHPNESNNVFIDTFDVPDEPIPLPDEDYEIEITYEIFVLLFFIRDSQGNYIVESIFFLISDPFSFDFIYLIIFGVFAVGVIGAIVFFVRRSSRNRLDPYSYRYSTSQTQTPVSLETASARDKFCIHCGQKIPRLASFCSHCGKNVDFKT